MAANKWLPFFLSAVVSCAASAESRELQSTMQELQDVLAQENENLVNHLFSTCECCSEDHFNTEMHRMFPSMPEKESDYFCNDDRSWYDSCKRTTTWHMSVWHYTFTFMAHAAGHNWWHPCAFTTLVDPDEDSNGCLSREEVAMLLFRVYERMWGWTYRGYYQSIDTDSNRCASKQEVSHYLVRSSPMCGDKLLDKIPCDNWTSSTECCVLPWDLSKQLVVALTRSFMAGQLAIEIAANGTEQSDQFRNEEEPGSAFLIPLISGIIAILALAACTAMYMYQRKQRAALCQPQKLLRAKIDAWSIFDSNLTAKTSTLHPSFVHCLGLGGFKSDQLSLLEITSAEHVATLEALLRQAKVNKNENSMPLMARVSFQYGVTQAADNQAPNKEYTKQCEQDIDVEILMAWSSSTSIIVGLTSLGAVGPPNALPSSLPDIEEILSQAHASIEYDPASQEEVSQGSPEYILNAASQVTGSASDAGTFRSMEAVDHRGGQVVKIFNDMKSDHFRRAISEKSKALEAEAGKVSPGHSASVSTDTGNFVSTDTGNFVVSTVSL